MSNLDESWYVQLLLDNTPYLDISLATETTLDLIHHSSPNPKITIGHEEIRLEFAETLTTNLYRELDNEEILLTLIQVICPRAGWVDVRNTIKAGYQGKSPFPEDSDYSSLGTAGTKVVAKTNTHVWFTEMIALVMPRIS